jgi:hypothetical protein
LKRSTTDILRRGFDSTVANWQLIAIRIAENFVFIVIVVLSIVAAIVPIAVAAGLSSFDPRSVADPGQAVISLLVEHWLLILYILGIITVVLMVLVGIHSFVVAGNTLVMVEAERRAGGAGGRAALRAFHIDRWLQGGRRAWWTVFWIYNLAWGIAGLIMLVPLLATLAGMLLVSQLGARAVLGCVGLLITFLVVVPLAIIVAVWTQKAIVVAVARDTGAADALRAGGSEKRRDVGRHFAVAFIVIAIAFGGAMLISMAGMPMQLGGRTPFAAIAFAPLQIISSLVQSIFSAAVGLWFLASYVALTEER